MNQSDPTDNALAAIASILDHSSEHPTAKPDQESEASHEATASTEVADIQAMPAPVAAPEIDVDHYSRLGPGPLDAIRFRWTARQDHTGNYFVDETIGPHSRPLSLGPMARHEVVQFIDDREAEARHRFEELKSEMTIGKRVPDYDSDAD